jgi:hypothetical protein
MNFVHKNKTLSCLLSVLGGSLGIHRFYLYGRRDVFGWVYFAASIIYLIMLAAFWGKDSLAANVALLFPIPVFVAAIEALSIGLTDDEKWDRRHNVQSFDRSKSRWPLAVILVLTLFSGFTALVACMARATDLLLTGGSFG